MIPVRSQWGRYNLPRYINLYIILYHYYHYHYYHYYMYICIYIYIYRYIIYVYSYKMGKNTQRVKLGYKWVSTVPQGINGSHCRSQWRPLSSPSSYTNSTGRSSKNQEMPGLEILVEDILGRIFFSCLERSRLIKSGSKYLKHIPIIPNL